MAHPALRDLLATREVKCGFWVNEFMTPAIGHILKAANCDLVVFDMEHSGLGFETIRSALRSAEAAGLRRSSAHRRSSITTSLARLTSELSR